MHGSLRGIYTQQVSTRHLDKAEEKQSQHAQLAQLMHALQVRGFEANSMVLTIKSGGTIY